MQCSVELGSKFEIAVAIAVGHKMTVVPKYNGVEVKKNGVVVINSPESAPRSWWGLAYLKDGFIVDIE